MMRGLLTFLSPPLAWGMLLGAVPIIIHLLNRRRYRRVDWAPMHYLKLTIQRNRRRIEIEQLLLLLLRIGLLVLLFFFLARPVLSPTGLEHWLGGGGRTSQIVLVDDSLSMGHATSDVEAFQRARELAAALLASVRPLDRCTIATTSAPRRPVVREVEGAKRDELRAAALSLKLTATHAAWPAVFDGVDELLRACAGPIRQLTIFTDLRKSGWEGSYSAAARRWRDDEVAVRIIDVGADAANNVELRSLLPLDRTVLAAAPCRWEAVIVNHSPRALNGAKAVLRVDDKPTEVALPEIAPGQSGRVPLTVAFPSPGMHDVSLRIADDELPGDNQRWAAVPVKDSLLVRLVDGEPSSTPFGSEVDYLAAPLSIGVGAAEAWRVEVAPQDDFLSRRRDVPDLLVLANMDAPTLEQADRLAELVREGMGLIVFTGAKIDTGLYNERLHGRELQLLPCGLKGLEDENVRGVVIEPLRPSPLEKLLDLKPSALERVVVRQYMAVDGPDEDDAVRVLARWNNPGRAPAVLERTVGEGRVLLWTTTADRAGNDWPVEPSFVLATREAVRGSARPTRLLHTLTAGEPMRRVVRSNQQITNVRLTSPGSGEPTSLAARPLASEADADEKDNGAPAVALDIADTRKAGLYRLDWEEGALGGQQDLFAANPDPRESPLERAQPSEIQKMLAPLRVDVIAARSGPVDLFSTSGREIWRDLARTLVVLLVVESVFATWAGRSR